MTTRIFEDFVYEQDQPREWWIQQAEIERDRNQRLAREAADANARAGWAHECAVVALRMLKRHNQLKAITDDERKVLEWASRLTELNPVTGLVGAKRRLGEPFPETYHETAEENAQFVLFKHVDEARA